MSKEKPKTTDALMRHLRDQKGIAISGSVQKRKLMNMGYYHGYKGYRYIGKATNSIAYSCFDELVAIYEFDAQLKALFYPAVMQIETAVKNYVLDSVVCAVQSDSFIDVYNKLLDNYKMYSTAGKSYKDDKQRSKAEEGFKRELKRRLDLRNRIYKVQTDAFNNSNKIAVHYLEKDSNLPIWATFELLSLGEFGHFVSCLNKRCRADISRRLGVRPSDDTHALMPQRLIYATKDLRNAIAHNDVVFDARFRSGSIDRQVCNAISNATGVVGLQFDTITDYLVLIVYQLKLLGISKPEIRKIVSGFEENAEKLRKAIPISVYSKIIHTDKNTKVAALRKYISL